MKYGSYYIIVLTLFTLIMLFTGCSKNSEASSDDSEETGISAAPSPDGESEETEPKLIPKSKKDYLNGSDLPEVSMAVSAKEDAMADMPKSITIKGVEYPTTLTSLTLDNMELTDEDIKDLRYMLNLTELHIYQNHITDLSPIQGLTELKTLSLFKNNISDLTPLAGLMELQTLYLRGNNISDITPIKGLTKITNLDLSDNQITDISALSEMKGMRLLKLNGNQIKSITPLSGMVMMDRLHLQDNLISDITPLSLMTSATEIYLDNNLVTDISPLTELKNLGWLKLSGNETEDFSPLCDLTALKKLYIKNVSVSAEQMDMLRENLPDCIFITQ